MGFWTHYLMANKPTLSQLLHQDKLAKNTENFAKTNKKSTFFFTIPTYLKIIQKSSFFLSLPLPSIFLNFPPSNKLQNKQKEHRRLVPRYERMKNWLKSTRKIFH